MFTLRTRSKRARVPCTLLLGWLILYALDATPSFSEPGPIWTVFTSENSELPDERILALAEGAHNDLWIGTYSGFAHFDKGQWQIYTKATTNGRLPGDRVFALIRSKASLPCCEFRAGLATILNAP